MVGRLFLYVFTFITLNIRDVEGKPPIKIINMVECDKQRYCVFKAHKFAATDPIIVEFLTHTTFKDVDFNEDSGLIDKIQEVFQEFARRRRKLLLTHPVILPLTGNGGKKGYMLYNPTHEVTQEMMRSWTKHDWDTKYRKLQIRHYCTSHLSFVESFRITLDCMYEENQVYTYNSTSGSGTSVINQSLSMEEPLRYLFSQFMTSHVSACYQYILTTSGTSLSLNTYCVCSGHAVCRRIHATRKCFVGEVKTKHFNISTGVGWVKESQFTGEDNMGLSRNAENGCSILFILSVDDKDPYMHFKFNVSSTPVYKMSNETVKQPFFANALQKKYLIKFPPNHMEKVFFALNYFLANYTITNEMKIETDRYMHNDCLFEPITLDKSGTTACATTVEVISTSNGDNVIFKFSNLTTEQYMFQSKKYRLIKEYNYTINTIQYMVEERMLRNTGKIHYTFICFEPKCHDELIRNHADFINGITTKHCFSENRVHTRHEMQLKKLSSLKKIPSRFGMCFQSIYKKFLDVKSVFFTLDTDGEQFLQQGQEVGGDKITVINFFKAVINTLYQIEGGELSMGRDEQLRRFDVFLKSCMGDLRGGCFKDENSTLLITKFNEQIREKFDVVSSQVLQSDRTAIRHCFNEVDENKLFFHKEFDPAMDYEREILGWCLSSQKLGEERKHDYFANGLPDRYRITDLEDLKTRSSNSWAVMLHHKRMNNSIVYEIYDTHCDYDSWRIFNREAGCKCYFLVQMQENVCCCYWVARRAYEYAFDKFISNNIKSIVTYNDWAVDELRYLVGDAV
ncbi:unnamed protein product [Bursaphelenchus okinawaensis]|uniref:Uncharacterized protein n=1 Tax=Bursaphelenchus okinawaensis TaxID=465554 RepID=A0A811KBC4_9BILA|nr:unnamed protein product [Bursaphelenchus okinawaensis]CAG9097165.1 unnamed protein product [Bursaphelenchus okinawaensis]